MADELRRGARFPPLILATKDADAYRMVMEGHVRLMAYLMAPECIPLELEVLLDFTERITRWGCY